ncbi:MAG: signal peptidase I [Proteobacteria bacterium]|nr:signal peptidase I [Pseudomonadota bacterium]
MTFPDSASPAFLKKLVSKTWVEEFEKTGTGLLRMLGGSMAPLIESGDQIFVERVSAAKVCIGDIITFWRDNILVTHRVIRKFKQGDKIFFVERGDQYSIHSIVPFTSVVGKVQQIKKNEHIYYLNSFIWKLYNKIAGIALLCTYYVRHIGRSTPGLPVPVKNLIKKIFVLFRWLMEWFCKMLIRTCQKKS